MIAENAPQDDGHDDLRLLTVSALAECLSVSVRQAHRMNKARLIPAPLKIGGCTRWRAAEVAAWLQAGSPVRSEWEAKRDTELAPIVENT